MPDERARGALEAAGYAGTWERRGDRLVLDAAAAALLLGDPALGGRDLDAEELSLRMGPEDRFGLAAALAKAGADGGMHQIEYTVRTEGGERRLAERGRFVADGRGGMRGIGVLLDLTRDPGPAVPEPPLQSAVEACIDLKRRIGRMPGSTALMGTLVDMLLLEFGFHLGRRLDRRARG